MGVTGLWTVVAPTARPTKLETLNRKRLAVDASIWIYQFLKAVRDKEGNALRNSHVVGFFRRICKLLYFGIKPVFVFDGGAPVLKRETIRSRARRREGRREDAVRTAGKLLSVQLARAAEEEEKRKRQERERTPIEEELPPDQELVYVDEIGMSKAERQAARSFKKKDQYHLPDLDMSIESLGAPNDPRIMSQAELEEYARQFHSGEDINLYDFSKIDFESPFFLSLPPGDRYNILNAARLRSRLRMGYSKEQLDGMFPDRMAFSRFQIERVKERNELTQRLMHINGMAEDSWNQGGRIVGEKGKEYVLVKNEGVEGGWALGVVSNKKGTKREEAINLDDEFDSDDLKQDSDDTEFEDVPIASLSRLPKSMQKSKNGLRDVDYDVSYEDAVAKIARKREAVYAARRKAADNKEVTQPPSRLHEQETVVGEQLFVPEEESDAESDLFEDVIMPADDDCDDDDLQRAIAMSMEQRGLESFEQVSMDGDTNFFTDDDAADLNAALAESRRSKMTSELGKQAKSPTTQQNFDGPLPFESLNLGQSLLGKKKSKKVEEELSGGFERSVENAAENKKAARPMPTWFDSAPAHQHSRQRNDPDVISVEVTNEQNTIQTSSKIQRQEIKEIIDLENDSFHDQRINSTTDKDTANLEELYQPLDDEELADDEDEKISDAEEEEKIKATEARERRYEMAREIAAENQSEELSSTGFAANAQSKLPGTDKMLESISKDQRKASQIHEQSDVSEDVEWSESDAEREEEKPNNSSDALSPVDGAVRNTSNRFSPNVADESENEDFEDVEMELPVMEASQKPTLHTEPTQDYLIEEPDEPSAENERQGFDDYLSDSDEEVMRQLVMEAEEHARFASELNNTKTPAQAARDYESELKQLRNQQKRDRRDADEVTQVMIQECQALLRLFGLPYITAPMEAEAQCAELVHLGLVDGIVTDDSDIFLFGGTRIYKNMFNAAKFVECYIASDLEKEYALDRRKLIRFAHLLGSDYTEGIPGIGPVTALEIISDFTSLENFKEWCSKVQLGRPQDLENQLTTAFRRKFKKTVQKKLFLPTSFPDLRVDHAYLSPEVDSSPEDFQWGVPDLDKLRGFLMATIGWNQERTDEVLVPVIRDMNKREQEGTQANLTRFFAGNVGVGANFEGAAPRNRTGKESGRMRNAYARLRGEAKKRRGQSDGEGSDVENVTVQQDEDDGLTDEDDGDNDYHGKETKRQKTKR